MKESMWMYMFATLGMTGLVLINLFGQVVVSNEQNYYLLKEITEAAMYDAVDLTAERDGIGYDGVTPKSDPESMHCLPFQPGTIRIIKEKFVESFVRRFAENAELNRNYRVIIHDIDECPPKVSISLIATNNFSFVTFFNIDFSNGQTAGSANIVNSLTGILETTSSGKVVANVTHTDAPEITKKEDEPAPTPAVDNTPPRCKVQGNSTWKKTAVTIYWGCEDDESGCVNTFIGKQTYDGDQQAAGFYPVTYTIEDRAGNKTTCDYTGKNSIPVYYDNYTPSCNLTAISDGVGGTVIRMDTDEEGSSLKFVGIDRNCNNITNNLYTSYAAHGPGTYCGKVVDNVDLVGYCHITLYPKNLDGSCPSGHSVGRFCSNR